MAEINLATKIQYLKGVGPKMGAKLNRLGIEKVEDLLMYFPRRYDDYTNISKIADLQNPKSEIASSAIVGEAIRNPKQIQNSNFKIDSLLSAQNNNNLAIQQFNNFTIRARIVGIANKKTRRRGFTVTEAVVEDGTGSIKVVWFNQPYLAKMLRAGSEVILNGKVSVDPYSCELAMESPNRANRPKIVPVYSETQGISSFYIARLVSGIRNNVSGIREFLPEKVIEQNNLLGIQQAISSIHEPKDSVMLERARKRLAFDELFFLSLRSQLSKVSNENKIAPKIQIEDKLLKEFTSKLPFALTEDQKKAAWRIIQDMKGNSPSVIARPEAVAIPNGRLLRKARNDNFTSPMNRLLNGDVGSGKTVVAAFTAYVAIRAGFRAVMMAPTEILAHQHFNTCSEILSKFGISVGLITSSQTKIQDTKNKVQTNSKSLNSKPNKASLANKASQANLVIGTHALIYEKANFSDIGLVIVDEQHRFGVEQRQALLTQNSNPSTDSGQALKTQNYNLKLKNLRAKERKNNLTIQQFNNQKMHPHFLSMTATPIPRTLYLALFADLDLSVIKTMPKGRKEIKTKIVSEVNRDKAYKFIREQIKKGRQAFVICPLIEIKSQKSKVKNVEEDLLNDKLTVQELFDIDRKSVVVEYDKLDKNIFPDLKIGMLHGRMKSKEKEAVMGDFKAQKLDILVSTSVVEVGVDIPNATIMMIEDAERFGLAGLHQFRGRVGRAEHQSYCFLFSNSKSPVAINRLRAMEETSDGFKLAEIDLKNRGAGDIFGTLQSGDLNLKMASLSDRILIEKASEEAKEIVAEGIDKYPQLLEKLNRFELNKHNE